MEPSDQPTRDRLLEELALVGHEALVLEERLAAARFKQRHLALLLVQRHNLSQAEVARVGQMHRQTLIKWTKKQSAETE